ncbi:MAG TPA: hypothetical protein VNM16_11910 [Bacillota bacterium]|nr:hypothetical protein [Bacillota bacterium]
MREGTFWPAVGIGAAAYFIAVELHIPFLSNLLAWAALAWAGYWYVENSPRQTLAWLWAAVVGAAAGVAGSVVGVLLTFVMSLLHPLRIPYELLALAGGLLSAVFVLLPLGAICGGIGGYIAMRRGGGRPWRRWDHGRD